MSQLSQRVEFDIGVTPDMLRRIADQLENIARIGVDVSEIHMSDITVGVQKIDNQCDFVLYVVVYIIPKSQLYGS